MKSFYSVALVLVVFLAIVQLGESSFAGTWLDSRGYTISLCITKGDKLQGSYQEFGIIQGDISKDGTTVQGTWYEARNPLSACPYGGFTFKLQNSNHWEGNFDCADETNADNYIWNGDRYSPDIVPSAIDCAILSDKGKIRGAYVVDPSISTDWDICTSGGTDYTSSYECDSNLDCFGYEEGFIYENGRVLLGGFTNVYPDGNTVDGSAIVALLNDSTLVHFQWASPITEARVIAYSQHVAEYDIAYSNTTGKSECNRNVEIYSDLYLHFSSSSLPNGYTVVSEYEDTTVEYDDQTTRSTVDQRYETSNSSHLTLCFILATIILLLV